MPLLPPPCQPGPLAGDSISFQGAGKTRIRSSSPLQASPSEREGKQQAEKEINAETTAKDKHANGVYAKQTANTTLSLLKKQTPSCSKEPKYGVDLTKKQALKRDLRS